ncbi:hypothetical protein HanRHA438_Chr14g0635071 [Helianthus annuus]|nr:hypothetical protein HanRHA438_Chr14g0635071 [Helianthus annuus]
MNVHTPRHLWHETMLATSEWTKWIFFLVGQLANTQLTSLLLHKSPAINRRLNLQSVFLLSHYIHTLKSSNRLLILTSDGGYKENPPTFPPCNEFTGVVCFAGSIGRSTHSLNEEQRSIVNYKTNRLSSSVLLRCCLFFLWEKVCSLRTTSAGICRRRGGPNVCSLQGEEGLFLYI